MSIEKTVLRTVETSVEAEGILSEKNLERAFDTNGKEINRGSLTLKIDDTRFIRFNVYAGKYTKDGKESAIYPGIETVMNEYHSIAEVGEENATKVRVSRGRLEPQSYLSRRNGQIVTGVRYSSNFFNRSGQNYEPKAEFKIEGFVSAVAPEIGKEGEETGRLKVTLLVPTYAGIEPFTMIVPEELSDSFMSYYDVGLTGTFYGDIINQTIVSEKVVKMAIGKDIHKESSQTIIEHVMSGAEEPYEEDDPKTFSTDIIRQALTERELRLEEMKQKAANQTTTAANPAANQSTTGRQIPKFSSAFSGTGF